MHRRVSLYLRVLLAGLVGTATLATVAPAIATNDQHWGLQWGPQRIGLEEAFAAGATGAGVRIGIVDTGVDLSHPDLAGKIVANAACIDTGGSTAKCVEGGGGDTDGHGTHVAGIAAAFKDNGVGIAGVAPGADLVVARVFRGRASNGARVGDVNAGIKWVVDRGAKVVNLSLGDSVPLQGEVFGGSSLEDGIQYAWDRGAVAVLAAGNTNYFGLGSANYGDVDALVVGATGRSDEPAGYSSPTGNAKWALVAPGGDKPLESSDTSLMIYSTLPAGRYGYDQGTSMAAPHVAGALALLMSRGQSNRQAVDTVLATVNRSVRCGTNSQNCRGRLDVACAVGRCTAPATTTTGATTATTRAPDGGSGATQAGGTSGSGSSDTGGSGSAPAPTASSGGSGSSGSSASGAGGSAAAPGPSRTTRRPSGLASRFGPPATEKPATPSADPAGSVPGDAVPPEQVGSETPSDSGKAEETPGRPLEAVELTRPSAVEERADPALATAAAVLLLLVSFSALGLRRRRHQP